MYNKQKLEEGLSENASGTITFQVDFTFHFCAYIHTKELRKQKKNS